MYPGLSKLAAQVIQAAVTDYRSATEKLNSGAFDELKVPSVRKKIQDPAFISLFKEFKRTRRSRRFRSVFVLMEIYQETAREKRECFDFLTNHSLWHEILDLNPAKISEIL